jgi:hypothetical protein
MTTTTTAPATASHAAERYALLLDDLGREPSRIERAVILDDMAEAADQLANLNYGRAARDAADGDTLSWAESGTLLRQLATAERGGTTVIAIPLDDDDTGDDGSDFTDWDAWAKVAAAATGDEYDEAVTALLDVLAAAPIPPFALRQFFTAAMACSAGHPDTYPTQA